MGILNAPKATMTESDIIEVENKFRDIENSDFRCSIYDPTQRAEYEAHKLEQAFEHRGIEFLLSAFTLIFSNYGMSWYNQNDAYNQARRKVFTDAKNAFAQLLNNPKIQPKEASQNTKQTLEGLFRIDEGELTGADIRYIDGLWDDIRYRTDEEKTYNNPEAEAKRVVKTFIECLFLFEDSYKIRALCHIKKGYQNEQGGDSYIAIRLLLDKTIKVMQGQANEDTSTSTLTEDTEQNASEVAGLHTGEDTHHSEGVDRLREETTSLEGIKELQKRIQELEEENQLQRNEIDRLTEKLEDKEDTQPRHGRPANSGLNRNERTALLMELLAGVTGIDATDLTGVSSNIQGQGLKALSCVSGLIVDISAGQRSKVLSEYREYQKKGQHEKIKEHRLQPERTNVVALIKEIEARKKQRGKG